LNPLFWGLVAIYDVYLRLLEKRVRIDFLLVLMELFLAIGATADAIQANSIENQRFGSNGVSSTQNFSVSKLG